MVTIAFSLYSNPGLSILKPVATYYVVRSAVCLKLPFFHHFLLNIAGVIFEGEMQYLTAKTTEK
jgi:hypothetical protein